MTRCLTPILLLLAAFLLPTPVFSQPSLGSSSAVLMELDSGRLLWEKEGSLRWPPASTTKILTALLVLENEGMEEKVKVSRRAATTAGSSAWLQEGEELTVRDLLYALLLPSANDAAVALAEKVGGSVEEFVRLMNEKALQLGAKNSHFANPHGLPQEDHYSTARDLALITREAWKDPNFRQIVGTRTWEVPCPGRQVNRLFYNRNRLLWEYPAARGVKTGFSLTSGPCLVAAASNREMELCAVLLNSQQAFGEAAQLLEYGFSYWEKVPVASRGIMVRTLPLSGGREDRLPLVYQKSLFLPLQEGEEGQLRREEDLPTGVRAPVKKGAPLGTVSFWLGQEKVGEVTLAAGKDVERAPLWGLFLKRLLESVRAAWRFLPRYLTR
ncbi:MAG: D-alanyl-D-alanine carboxypeptidase [Firmicutes bacterium]|nr:D-alanyl-D-alanine carboxypeptidase [Bacillota bacterium]